MQHTGLGHTETSVYANQGKADGMTDKHVIQMRIQHRENNLSIRELMNMFNVTERCVLAHLHTAKEIEDNRLNGTPLPYASQMVTAEQVERDAITKREDALAEREAALAAREAALEATAGDNLPPIEISDSEGMDEFGPLKGTPEYELLGASAKGQLTKKRNQAADAA